MKRFGFQMGLIMSLVFMAILAVPVLAAPPFDGGPGRGSGNSHNVKNQKHNAPKAHDYRGHRDQRGSNHKVHDTRKYVGPHRYFTDHHRVVIHDYYASQYRKGLCPPGLAKKGYGCVPRKPARQWVVGRPLPRTVIFHDLPPQVVVHLGPAPSRHRFVRVVQDILLIATGTGMVVDAIDNLSWEFSR